ILTLSLVLVRMVSLYAGSYLGGRLAGAGREIKNYSWMAFSAQAGVSMGLAVLIAQSIPGEIGSSIKSLIIATIAINQIVGPVLCRQALEKAGEIPQPA
ncbi:MAG: potassium transporter TrkA, partial [Calditrichia bacterium]